MFVFKLFAAVGGVFLMTAGSLLTWGNWMLLGLVIVLASGLLVYGLTPTVPHKPQF